jgi:hypothetical protein
MSARSLFAKVRDSALALGKSERTATRKARLLSSASFSDFVRLTPEQNAKLGLSPKARHYVLKGGRITKAAPTISARQFETKRAAELFGLTPERATQARRHGAVSYVSADQRERVAKAAITREENKVVAAIKKLRASGETVPSNSPDNRRHERRIRSQSTRRAVTALSGVASSRANTFPTASGSGSSTTRAA